MELFGEYRWYFIAVFSIGVILFVFLRLYLRRFQNRGSGFIKKVRRFDAVRPRKGSKSMVANQREEALENFHSRFSIVKRTVLFLFVFVWLLLLVFPLFNKVSAAAISIFAAVITVIVGTAARPFVENFIAGIVITFSRQLRTGDTVTIDDAYGTVEDISMTHTIIKLWNWKRYIIPNSRMLNKELVSFTTKDSFIWTHVEFYVAYDAPLEVVRQLATETAQHSSYNGGSELPSFWVMEMEKDAVKCWIAAWTKSPADSWYLKIDIRNKLIEKLQQHNIRCHMAQVQHSGTIPVTLHNQEAKKKRPPEY
ncbi:MAG: mechanosensitive ion channel [Bacteroidales bacterium]